MEVESMEIKMIEGTGMLEAALKQARARKKPIRIPLRRGYTLLVTPTATRIYVERGDIETMEPFRVKIWGDMVEYTERGGEFHPIRLGELKAKIEASIEKDERRMEAI